MITFYNMITNTNNIMIIITDNDIIITYTDQYVVRLQKKVVSTVYRPPVI